MDDSLKRVMDEVKKTLEDSFGAGMAARILLAAREAIDAPVILSKDKVIDLVRAICADDRVKQLWGDFGVRERLARWEKLLS